MADYRPSKGKPAMNDFADLELILDEIVTLPSLPSSVIKLQGMINDPDVALKDIGEVISTDPAVALKTLRLVNSAQYGRGTKITSVEHACTMLGINVIRNLVLSAAVLEQMQAGTDQFMKHSLATGMAAEMTAAASPNVLIPPDEAFVYGVLHDIGKMIFLEHVEERFTSAIELAESTQIPLYKAEHSILGADHAKMGARLAVHWKLPDALVDAIGGHHDLSQCINDSHRPLAALVAAANYMVWAAGFTSGTSVPPEIPDGTWEALGIGSSDIPAIVDDFLDAVPNLGELLTLAGG